MAQSVIFRTSTNEFYEKKLRGEKGERDKNENYKWTLDLQSATVFKCGAEAFLKTHKERWPLKIIEILLVDPRKSVVAPIDAEVVVASPVPWSPAQEGYSRLSKSEWPGMHECWTKPGEYVFLFNNHLPNPNLSLNLEAVKAAYNIANEIASSVQVIFRLKDEKIIRCPLGMILVHGKTLQGEQEKGGPFLMIEEATLRELIK
jgi:hypothetical protein